MVKGKTIEGEGFRGVGGDITLEVLKKLVVKSGDDCMGRIVPGWQGEPLALPILTLSESGKDVVNANFVLEGAIFGKEPKVLNVTKLWNTTRRA